MGGDASEPTSPAAQSPVQEGIASSSHASRPQSSLTGHLQRGSLVVHNLASSQPQQLGPPDHAFSSQLEIPRQGNQRSGPYIIGTAANALVQPAYQHGTYSQPHQGYSPAQPGHPAAYQQTAMAQFPPHASFDMPGQHYGLPQHPQVQAYYTTPISPLEQQALLASRPTISYYTDQAVVGHAQQQQISAGYYYPQANQPTAHGQTIGPQAPPTPFASAGASNLHPRSPSQAQGGDHGAARELRKSQEVATVLQDGLQGVARGPPRKPKQSGHAIWIGNLPPQTDLMSLVHHVCKEARAVQSLFLISKSNCAFANFKDEETCIAAQQKLHDSKFLSFRLVSRLRKSTVEGASGLIAPTAPSGLSGSSASPTPPEAPTTPGQDDLKKLEENLVVASGSRSSPAGETTQKRDRFFILKSLTVEDLELSVRTGIWATQAHNEETLNQAFKEADDVYLLFSANKSGEYFGYARMTSEIDGDPAAAIEFAPKSRSANDLDLPKAIPTEATEFAPRGRIIDDSSRGTIFWEAERDEADDVDEDEEDLESVPSGRETPKACGKPFKLDWLSTARLPFYRTRGLRNPWNSNREVKIARDGTELEPSVGRKLINLFNHAQSLAPAPATVQAPGIANMAAFYPQSPHATTQQDGPTHPPYR